jgi:hypothetical protein
MLNVIMLNFIMLNVTIPNVITLSVDILRVVVPCKLSEPSQVKHFIVTNTLAYFATVLLTKKYFHNNAN